MLQHKPINKVLLGCRNHGITHAFKKIISVLYVLSPLLFFFQNRLIVFSCSYKLSREELIGFFESSKVFQRNYAEETKNFIEFEIFFAILCDI